MTKTECDVMQDLMPLCIDGVASEESKRRVEAHVATCADCASTYAAMRTELAAPEPAPDKESFAAAMRRLRKTRVWVAQRNILIGILIGAAVLYFGMMGYNELRHKMVYPMAQENYTAALSKRADGRIMATVDENKKLDMGISFSLVQTNEPAGGSITDCYLTMTQELWPTYTENTGVFENKTIYTYATPWRMDEDGNMLVENLGEWVQVTEIRVGESGRYTTLYRAGDEVPACSAELEDWLAVGEKYDAALEEAYQLQKKADMEYSEAIRSFDADSVPEWRGDAEAE